MSDRTLEQRVAILEGEQRLTRSALNELGRRCGELPDKTHEERWNEAMKNVDSRTRNPESGLYKGPHLYGKQEEEDTKPLTLRDLEPDAAFVEQVEVILDEDMVYKTRLRFDDDTTEELSRHTLRASALDYATEQARRYRIPIFDSTYEKLVD